MEWFRWWHGTATDPKFRSVATKTGKSVAEVLAVWVCLLEHASAVTPGDEGVTRGDITRFDCDDADVLLGLPEGSSAAILGAFETKGMVDAGRISRWSERQPKREDSSAARTRAYRARKAQQAVQPAATPCDALVTGGDAPEEIRSEESDRKEEHIGHAIQSGYTAARFGDFWAAYPRKVKRKPALEIWKRKRLDRVADNLIADVNRRQQHDRRWRDGYVPDPTTYLNQERWEDEITKSNPCAPKSADSIPGAIKPPTLKLLTGRDQ